MSALGEAQLRQRPATDAAAVPAHVGIIMDGNGRWAEARGLPRAAGHRKGVEALRRAVRHAGELGVRYLTVFSFSSENWSRPAQEIASLMALLRRFIQEDLRELHQANVRVRPIGRRDNLSPEIESLLRNAEDTTRGNTGMTLFVAFNYGGRDEIVRACQAIARGVQTGAVSPDAIDEDMIAAHLDTAGVPDPDMIIRTSGECRLSNFTMWQAAYSEFVFVPVHWPDFDEAALDSAIAEFRNRSRRFGSVAADAGGG
ncbi:isoprenyl transferase [Amorphus orientalis]|uniref:Isoprenyl transferase n=1 Tax=Amorphus orientalis TaxID=649198 RepID=A0AAE3VPU4_9HYPH|nr:isoprenyl transferase [Amorphus orientalis]MDQ0315546.1 undecaprenyl diphosphate synthase [Amorphus orientalis]